MAVLEALSQTQSVQQLELRATVQRNLLPQVIEAVQALDHAHESGDRRHTQEVNRQGTFGRLTSRFKIR